jgi:hypothetical protein
MDDLLREAIADAKSVRETALANAKIALEEAFTPRLQSMLSRKIESEMDAEEQEDAEESEMDAEESEMAPEEMMDKDEMEDAEESEMDAEESEMAPEEMEDAEESEMDAEESEMDAEEMMDKEEEDSVEEQEDAEEEDSVEESEDAEENEDAEEMREQEDAEEEDELDLESVLAELEADLKDAEEEDELEEMEDKDEEDKVEENDVSSEIGKADNKVADKANDSSSVGQGPESEGSDKKAGAELDDHKVVKEEEDKEENDLDLDEVLKALSEEEDAEEEADKVEELKKEITETRNVVKFMRAKLNEVNLLNAKLLFSNKLFRAFGLNNNQKLKVVENFDRTKNLREVKLVYATLAESFKSPKKLSESVSKGSSSKPTRSTKPAKAQVLSEGAEMKARFKKLANIL